MEVRYVLWLIKKWFWLMILAVLIGGAVAVGVNLLQPKVYQATTTLYVSSLNRSDYQSELGAQQAAKAFALFPQSGKVIQSTLAAVGERNLSFSQLSSMITVQNDLNSQFVVINVRNSDPRLAAQLATEVAKQSVAQFMASQTNNIQNQQFILQQLASLQTEINDLQKQLVKAQLGVPTSAQTALVNRLTTKLSNDRQTYNQLLSSEASIGGFQVMDVQQPAIPQSPVGLGRLLTAALGMLVGLIVIVCVLLFFEQANSILVIRPGDQIRVLDQETGLPMVITVKDLSTTKMPEPEAIPNLDKIVISKQISATIASETSPKGVALNGHDTMNTSAKETPEPEVTMRLHRSKIKDKIPQQTDTPKVIEALRKDGIAPNDLDQQGLQRGPTEL